MEKTVTNGIKNLIVSAGLLIMMVSIIYFFSTIWPETPASASTETYENINLRVVSINSDCSLTDDKFHQPQLCNTVLFETLTGQHLYAEINTCENNGRIHIDTPWLYNHRKGDTVHFEYIFKRRFFEIKNR